MIDIEIDQKQLKNIKNEFIRLAQTRLMRIESGLTAKQADCFKILPLLFHVNHPLLPGYFDKETPCGLTNYTPTTVQKSIVKTITKSFEFKPRAQLKYEISSLFLMGSMGTLGQSSDSDIDLWICLDKALENNLEDKLVAKSNKIKQWYCEVGIELNFYIVNSNDFKTNKKKKITADDCGNTQKYLLLDEFYRTSVWLVGKWPLWWLIPLDEKYDEHANKLINQKHLDSYEWIDFGEVKKIPPSEYLSAAIWQLYKSIESPYKSFSKLLLLENYAKKFPCKGILSNELKLNVYNRQSNYNSDNKELDPYLEMLIFIENNLLGEDDRLDFSRKSFYLKSNVKINLLNIKSSNWKYLIIYNLVKKWGWSQEKINNLNNRYQWNVNNIIEERKSLVNELTKSYDFLSSFYRFHEKNNHSKSTELILLGRKLHATFERRSGKIEKLNNAIAKNINEQEVTLLERKNGGWSLYIELLSATNVETYKPSFTAFSLFECLCWAVVNTVIIKTTRFHVISNNDYFNDHLVSQISRDIISFLKDNHEKTLFNKPASEKILGVFINTRFDPLLKDKKENVYRILTDSELLSSDGDMNNLASHFDVICINSWGEITTQFYSGDTAWIDFYQRYKNIFKTSKKMLSIYCRGLVQNSNIITRVDSLLNKWRLMMLNSIKTSSINRYLMLVGKSRFIIDFHNDEIFYNTFQSTKQYYKNLGQCHFSELDDQLIKLNIDKCISLDIFIKTVIKRRVSESIDCYIYEKSKGTMDLIIRSVNGLLHYQSHKNVNLKQLVSHYKQFYNKIKTRNRFVAEASEEIRFYECRSSENQQIKIKPVKLDEKDHFQPFSLLQAIATQDSISGTGFNLFTAHSSYYYLNDGENVYQKMKNQLTKLRKTGSNYPIFITDLDLSAKLAKVTLMELLSYKQMIESKLNKKVKILG